jgi:rhomboid family GlyGly-CTERM serine protease
MRAATQRNWPWVSVIVVAACLLLAPTPASLIEHLSGERSAILRGELWRLWTGHLVHFSLRHALIDSMTLLVIGTLAESEFGSRRVALLMLAGAPLISIGMLLTSPTLDYRGASCIAVMLATAIGWSWWRSRPSSRAALTILALCLAAKIGFDAIGMSVTLADLPDKVTVAWQGHLLGGVLGGLWYLAVTRAQYPGTASVVARLLNHSP